MPSGCKGRHFVSHSPNMKWAEPFDFAINAIRFFLFLKFKKISEIYGGDSLFFVFYTNVAFFFAFEPTNERFLSSKSH